MALSKPKLLQTLPLLSLIALFLMLAKPVHSAEATSFTYDNFYPNTEGLTYQGGYQFPSGTTALRLTNTDTSGNPLANSAGRVLYSSPIEFWEPNPAKQASFETTIKFVITSVDNDPADGIAFFIGPVNSSIGYTGGSLGIFDSSGKSSSLFAVEFDIFVNSWDPDYRHIGIDINSQTSVNVTKFENALDQEVTARINYEADTRRISVHATAGSQHFEVDYVYDLKTILPAQVQVGISASTGTNVAIYDIHAWYFSSTMVYENPEFKYNSENDHSNIRQYV